MNEFKKELDAAHAEEMTKFIVRGVLLFVGLVCAAFVSCSYIEHQTARMGDRCIHCLRATEESGCMNLGGAIGQCRKLCESEKTP